MGLKTMVKALGLVLMLGSLFACGPKYGAVANQAAARGDWREAYDNYVRAMEQSPEDTALAAKVANARSQAVA